MIEENITGKPALGLGHANGRSGLRKEIRW